MCQHIHYQGAACMMYEPELSTTNAHGHISEKTLIVGLVFLKNNRSTEMTDVDKRVVVLSTALA